MMRVIGLTGSIGMGKSTVAAMLRRMAVPVFSSDEAVHQLLGSNGKAYHIIVRAWPEVMENGLINRHKLGAIVFADADQRQRLEAILHPLVAEEQQRFIRKASMARRPIVVLDIPLLFETKQEGIMDEIWLVTAPCFIQKRRVLRRVGMTPDKLATIRRLQLPEAIKRKHADRVLHTGLGMGYTQRQIREWMGGS